MQEYCFTSSELNYTIELCVLSVRADSHTYPRWARICWSIISVTLAMAIQNRVSGSSKILLWFHLFLKDQKEKKLAEYSLVVISHGPYPQHSDICQIPQCSRKLYLLNPVFSVSELFTYTMNLPLNQRPFNTQDRKQRPYIDRKDSEHVFSELEDITVIKANPTESIAWTNLITHWQNWAQSPEFYIFFK